MFKSLVATTLIGMAVLSASPANAQTVPTTSAGTLTCQLAPSIGLIIGSRQRMACRFVPNGPYPPEAYVGVIGTIGLRHPHHCGRRAGVGCSAPPLAHARQTRRDLCRSERRSGCRCGCRRKPSVRWIKSLDRSAATFGRGYLVGMISRLDFSLTLALAQ